MFPVPSLIRLRSAGAILCLHGVTVPEAPGNGVVHVPLAKLREIVALAREAGEIVPLQDLVRLHQSGRSTAGLLALTMDDAYASVLPAARDVLQPAAIPVTVFVVLDAAASGATYWWDRVDDLYPRFTRARWRAFEDACGVPEEYRRGHRGGFGPLRPLRQWMLATYAGRWPRALEPALRELEAQAGMRTAQRSMTFDELEQLRHLPGVDIGVHTVSHPVLPLLDDAELQHEIGGAWQALRERVPSAMPFLSIPFGLYDRRTVATARSCGMSVSLTLAERTLRAHPDCDQLPRFCICRGDSLARMRVRMAGLTEQPGWGRAPSRVPYPALPSPTT